METWQNWSGKLQATPAAIHHLRSEEDAAALAQRAADEGITVRATGAGHSHAPLVPTDGVIVDTSGLAGVISTDPDTRRAQVWAGTPIHALGRPLHQAGMALVNQGDIDRQSIGGAVATGTHGTGLALPSLSAMVTGARIATAAGELVDCSAGDDAELYQASRIGLGALGIVTRLELQLRDAYRLRQAGWTEPLDDLLSDLDRHANDHRHFEFFWFPTADMVVAKVTDETDDAAEYPVAEEGSRCAWSYEVLPNHRSWLHTEMEYSVPFEQGPDCLLAIRELLRSRFPEMGWPVEYRTLAADDVWLSTAYDRPTVTISLHVDAGEDEHPLFEACEEVFVEFDGRPHWGKVHHRSGAELAALHPRWSDWWRVRDRVDPGGAFLNDHLRAARDGDDAG